MTGAARLVEGTMIATFPANRYLADTRCHEVLLELSRGWSGLNPSVESRLAPFHPLSADEIKQASELDCYVLQSIENTLNRVHIVKKGDAVAINPPPDDYRCESCRAKTWLLKAYGISKTDGANSVVWLCIECAKTSKAMVVRQPDLDPQRPKIGVSLLDENSRLLALMEDTLNAAILGVKQEGSLSPFVTSKRGSRKG